MESSVLSANTPALYGKVEDYLQGKPLKYQTKKSGVNKRSNRSTPSTMGQRETKPMAWDITIPDSHAKLQLHLLLLLWFTDPYNYR